MTLQLNQFNQAPVQGLIDMQMGGSVITAQIHSGSAGGLVPGTPVKLVDVAGKIPLVVECSADTDDVFGFINYNIKNTTFDAGDQAEIALVNGGSVMFMTASAAIARGASVMIVVSGTKIATATSTKTIVGRMMDKAAADGDLVRVLMLPVKQAVA